MEPNKIVHTGQPSRRHVEFNLVVALARPTIDDDGAIRALLTRHPDWNCVIELAATHRVVSYIYHNLKTSFIDAVPDTVLERLRALYLHRLRRSIHIRGELPRLLQRLHDRGIEALSFKGPVLAELAYENPSLRTFTDLDVLIRPGDVEATVRTLEQAGFREKNPLPATYDTTWNTYWPWHPPHGNANGYVRGDTGPGPGDLHVDIHWGLASRYFLFPLEPEELWQRRIQVPTPGGETVYTFSVEDTLLVQCMHAAKDAYYRLRHICDIAELLHIHPTLDGAWVLERAQSLRCATMVRLGLKLSHDLLGAPLPAGIPPSAIQSSTLADLARTVTNALFQRRHGLSRLLHLCRFHMNVRDHTRDGLGAVVHSMRTSLQSIRPRSTGSPRSN